MTTDYAELARELRQRHESIVVKCECGYKFGCGTGQMAHYDRERLLAALDHLSAENARLREALEDTLRVWFNDVRDTFNAEDFAQWPTVIKARAALQQGDKK